LKIGIEICLISFYFIFSKFSHVQQQQLWLVIL